MKMLRCHCMYPCSSVGPRSTLFIFSLFQSGLFFKIAESGLKKAGVGFLLRWPVTC